MNPSYKPLPYRWAVLAAYMFVNLTIQMLWISFAPVTGHCRGILRRNGFKDRSFVDELHDCFYPVIHTGFLGHRYPRRPEIGGVRRRRHGALRRSSGTGGKPLSDGTDFNVLYRGYSASFTELLDDDAGKMVSAGSAGDGCGNDYFGESHRHGPRNGGSSDDDGIGDGY